MWLKISNGIFVVAAVVVEMILAKKQCNWYRFISKNCVGIELLYHVIELNTRGNKHVLLPSMLSELTFLYWYSPVWYALDFFLADISRKLINKYNFASSKAYPLKVLIDLADPFYLWQLHDFFFEFVFSVARCWY